MAAPQDLPVATQVTIEEPVTNVVEAVTPRYDCVFDAFKFSVIATNTNHSGHFSSVSADDNSCRVTSPEAR